ncbi:MAG: macro domain-containing protein [Lachnospiraceae bacterium]|nr:macro domain-containing protein [Lachnospiraceae bacterium]
MPFQIIRNDITKVKADAIVNTANPDPVIGGGTDAAIYLAAGEDKLLAERQKIGKIARGDVAVTPAFGLRAKYVIHTVGPVWQGGGKHEFEILASCYAKALDAAWELGCESTAFPLIAAGTYGFPKAQALQIAVQEICGFLMRDDVDMVAKLVVFDDKAFRLSKGLFFEVESFVTDEDVIKAHREEYAIDDTEFWRQRRRELARRELVFNAVADGSALPHFSKTFDESTFDKNLYMNDDKDDTSFRDHLIKLMNEKKLDNAQVYKSSNVTKGAFSKIMCGDTKKPQKKAVLGFCIGLKLNLEEAQGLLASADLAFNPYDKRDRLVIQCIKRGQYNIFTINQMLYVCNQPLLGN